MLNAGSTRPWPNGGLVMWLVLVVWTAVLAFAVVVACEVISREFDRFMRSLAAA